jgi:hypothetical protein
VFEIGHLKLSFTRIERKQNGGGILDFRSLRVSLSKFKSELKSAAIISLYILEGVH